MDTAKVHQKRVAESTLKMSIIGASIMGGMNHAEAYKILFNQDLKSRLEYLLQTYPNATKEHWVSTELNKYGWSTADDWKELLKSL